MWKYQETRLNFDNKRLFYAFKERKNFWIWSNPQFSVIFIIPENPAEKTPFLLKSEWRNNRGEWD